MSVRAKAMNWRRDRGQLHFRTKKFPVSITHGVSYSEAGGGLVNLNLEHRDSSDEDGNPERRTLFIELDEYAAVSLVAELQSALHWIERKRKGAPDGQ